MHGARRTLLDCRYIWPERTKSAANPRKQIGTDLAKTLPQSRSASSETLLESAEKLISPRP